LCGEEADGFENDSMVRAIEIVGPQNVGDVIPSGGVEEQAAQNGLLRLD
jgi:hypothetical protein